MPIEKRRKARSHREAGQSRVDTVYRLLTLPPKAFLAAHGARKAAGARIEAREGLRVGIWESEGGSLPPEVAAVHPHAGTIADLS